MNTSSTSVASVSETMTVLMKSVGRYVHKRITSKKGKDAYRYAMKECIQCMSEGIQNLDMIKKRIEALESEIQARYPTTFFNRTRSEERVHFMMAINQALEIVRSLEGRFLTGMSDASPRGYGDKGTVYHHDEELFN